MEVPNLLAQLFLAVAAVVVRKEGHVAGACVAVVAETVALAVGVDFLIVQAVYGIRHVEQQ